MSSSPTLGARVDPEAVSSVLFAETAASVFAVLDAASIDDLPGILHAESPPFCCLYRGQLEPDMAHVAPYLVQLLPEHPLTEMVITEGWGRHWGVFIHSEAGLMDLRRHFRKFLMVRDPAGKQLYFRFYDPRVLRVFLPTCNAAELETLFGPVLRYLCEDPQAPRAVALSRKNGKLVTETHQLAEKLS